MKTGQIIAGDVGRIFIREKSGEKIELGDLLVVDDSEGFLLLQVYNLLYGSQISKLAREQIAGLDLEGYGVGLQFFDPQLRNYIVAQGKSVLRMTNEPQTPKILPDFFGPVRRVQESDLKFLGTPQNPIFLGNIRSGSKVLKVPVFLDSAETLVHHVLIPSTTGRGKSNLVKVMLWSLMAHREVGALVLDPHDEYYGRSGKGLRNHSNQKDALRYYSVNPVSGSLGSMTLVVNLRNISPQHLEGIMPLSDAQIRAVRSYFQQFPQDWIEQILIGTPIQGVSPNTVSVLGRIFNTKLSVCFERGQLICKNRIFSTTAGNSTIKDIADSLENGRIVVIDTSKIGDEAELLIGSMVANEVFDRYQNYKSEGALEGKRPISVVIEEAPRVLSETKLRSGDNIYSKIAREGRKFKIGLMAITQLTSVIPRDILTNMNTKIILGNEMSTERKAIIDSAAQDLSDDDRAIASLDRGEAIVTSIFTKFAVPIKIPKFEVLVEDEGKKDSSPSIEYKG